MVLGGGQPLKAKLVAVIRFIFHWQINSLTEVNWLNRNNQIHQWKDTKSRTFCEKKGNSLSLTSSHQGVNNTE